MSGREELSGTDRDEAAAVEDFAGVEGLASVRAGECEVVGVQRRFLVLQLLQVQSPVRTLAVSCVAGVSPLALLPLAPLGPFHWTAREHLLSLTDVRQC